MKKLVSILLITLLLFPFIVLADGGGPTFAPYEAYVTSKDGASLYYEKYTYGEGTSYVKTTTVLDYNTKITIEDEIEVSDGVIYGNIEYEEEWYYINLKNVKPLKEEYTYDDLKKDFSEYTDYEGDNKLFYNDSVILAEDAAIWKGPSTNYAKTDTIVKKEEVIKRKANIGYWTYVESSYGSGWIHNEDEIVMEKFDHTLWAIAPIPTFSSHDISNKANVSDVVIPKNQKFDNVYEYDAYDEKEDVWINLYRIEYEGNIYYIDADDALMALSTTYGENRLTFDKTDCYDEINGTIIAEIPANTKIKEKYYAVNDNKNGYYNGKLNGDEWIYIEYNGKEYWIVESGNSINFFEIATYIDDKIILTDDVEASTTFDHNHEHPDITIPVNTQFDGYYRADVAYYVKYEGKNYWLNTTEGEVSQYIGDDWSEYETSRDLHLYDKPNGTQKDVVIPADTTIDIRYEYSEETGDNHTVYWYYVDTKKYKGWINENENEMSDFREELAKNQVNETVMDRETKVRIKPTTNTKKNIEPEIVKKDNSLSKKEMIVICSLSAVILCLAITVIILLINKKKKVAVKTVETAPVVEQPKEDTTNNVETKQEENKDA